MARRVRSRAMAAHSSTVRPASRLGSVLTLVPLTLVIAALWLAGLGSGGAVLVGSALYLLYRYVVVRRVLLRDHRRGVIELRAGRFEAGLEAFVRSEQVWAKRPRLDRYRALLLGSAAAHGFHLLARYNQAYALSRLGEGEEAIARLDEVLERAPDMLVARELRDVLLAGSRLHPDVGRAMKGEG